MHVNVNHVNGQARLELRGPVRLYLAPGLQAGPTKPAFATGDVGEVVVDMRDVEYLDSSPWACCCSCATRGKSLAKPVSLANCTGGGTRRAAGGELRQALHPTIRTAAPARRCGRVPIAPVARFMHNAVRQVCCRRMDLGVSQMGAAPPEMDIPAFVDVEASSLGPRGYPIEVGLITRDGSMYCTLILPPPDWSGRDDVAWDADAERVHGITRGILLAHGKPLCRKWPRELNRVARGLVLFSDAWGQRLWRGWRALFRRRRSADAFPGGKPRASCSARLKPGAGARAKQQCDRRAPTQAPPRQQRRQNPAAHRCSASRAVKRVLAVLFRGSVIPCIWVRPGFAACADCAPIAA